MGKFEEASRKLAKAINTHDLDALAKAYASDAVAYDPMYPEPLRGREAIKKDSADFFRAFPDLRFEISNVVEKDDGLGAGEVVMSGTHTGPLATPTGAMDAEHVAHTLELREHARELLDTRDLQGRVHGGGLVGIRLRRKREELYLVLADHGRDVAQEPVAVPAFDADRDRVRARRRALPLHVDEALFVCTSLHVRAVRAVDGDPATASDVTHDLVAGHRVAAHAEADEEVADALHVHAAARRVRGQRRRDLRDRELRVV